MSMQLKKQHANRYMIDYDFVRHVKKSLLEYMDFHTSSRSFSLKQYIKDQLQKNYL